MGEGRNRQIRETCRQLGLPVEGISRSRGAAPGPGQLDAWRRGIILEDGYKTEPVGLRFESAPGKGAWLRVIMKEGRKCQICETCKQLGLPVVRILRIRIG